MEALTHEPLSKTTTSIHNSHTGQQLTPKHAPPCKSSAFHCLFLTFHENYSPNSPAHTSCMLPDQQLAQTRNRQISLRYHCSPESQLSRIGSNYTSIKLPFPLANSVVKPPLSKSPMSHGTPNHQTCENQTQVPLDERSMIPFLLAIHNKTVHHSDVQEKPYCEDNSLERCFSYVEAVDEFPGEVVS